MIKNCPNVKKCIVVKRTGNKVDWVKGRDVWYEDLIKDTSDEFLKILEFLKNNNMSFEINKAKISKTVNSTTFNKLKNLEKKEGFIETIENGNEKGKPFFFKGGSRDYKKQLSSANSNEIFQKFYNVMKELGYINRRVNHL